MRQFRLVFSSYNFPEMQLQPYLIFICITYGIIRRYPGIFSSQASSGRSTLAPIVAMPDDSASYVSSQFYRYQSSSFLQQHNGVNQSFSKVIFQQQSSTSSKFQCHYQCTRFDRQFLWGSNHLRICPSNLKIAS